MLDSDTYNILESMKTKKEKAQISAKEARAMTDKAPSSLDKAMDIIYEVIKKDAADGKDVTVINENQYGCEDYNTITNKLTELGYEVEMGFEDHSRVLRIFW